MRNVMISSALAMACMFAAVLPASSMPGAPLTDEASAPAVTLVSGGCGPFAHRTPWGACRPNGPIVYRRYGWGGWHRHWHRW